MGRAQATIAPSLKKLGRDQETLPWLREFSYLAKDVETGEPHIMWDMKPEYFSSLKKTDEVVIPKKLIKAEKEMNGEITIFDCVFCGALFLGFIVLVILSFIIILPERCISPPLKTPQV